MLGGRLVALRGDGGKGERARVLMLVRRSAQERREEGEDLQRSHQVAVGRLCSAVKDGCLAWSGWLRCNAELMAALRGWSDARVQE